MADKDDTSKPPVGGEGSFGEGLGPDFTALGRRIRIRPGVNHVKLKRRQRMPPGELGRDEEQRPGDTKSEK